MSPRRSAFVVLAALLVAVFLFGRYSPAKSGPLRAVLLDAAHCSRAELAHVREGGANGVVLVLDSTGEDPLRQAAERIRDLDLELYYWIEIARDPELAEREPQLVAGMGAHQNWRAAFPEVPEVGATQRCVAWPWVPIFYAAAFDLQLAKIEARLEHVPDPDGLFLNDLQAAPAACGCGNGLCRWVVDYLCEPRAVLAEAPIAARFLERVRARLPGKRVVPVWTGECREHEETERAACHGVPCYTGRCWPALIDELRPVVEQGGSIALQLFGERIPAELLDFPAELMRRQLELPSERILPILRGWDQPEPSAIEAVTRAANAAGMHEWVLALIPLEQGFEPRVVSR